MTNKLSDKDKKDWEKFVESNEKIENKKLKKIEKSNVKVMDGIKEKVEFKLPAGIRYKKSKKELIA